MSSETLPRNKQSRATAHLSWRYGTHFGNPNKEPAIQDIVSTTTFSESDSEPDPSVYDISAADFPEPPPIGSPVIRRMRSSPWFLPERGFDKDFSDVQHWRLRVPVDDLRSHSRRYDSRQEPPSMFAKEKTRIDPFSSTGQSSENILSGRHMASSSRNNGRKVELEHWERLQSFDINDLSSSDLHPGISTGNISSESGMLSDRTTPRPIRFSRDLPSMTDLNINSDRTDCGHNTISGKQEVRPLTLGSLPRIIRKVASMRSDGQKGDINGGGDNFNIPSRSGQKTLPKARSFRSILRTSEGDQAFKRNSHVEGARNIWPSASVPRDIDLGPIKPSINQVQDRGHFEETNRQRVWHHHLSSPVTGSGVSGSSDQQFHSKFADDASIPGRLASPFSHRTEQKSTSSQKTLFTQERPKATKSFIDFTPDQGAKSKTGAKRERMKNIVARASNSFLGWGKWRTKSSAV
ncbi:hypothetical protein CVT25_015045 [Psilocybe cyanescens]|uniref:Uncharacterized protein n=1 Tax=Psilocybe cyanescens TaxID=93625 RepID=A0A409VPP1_PSICY|nr:hypothetical protein CVT25_015045 [Psilocybe cyanescens]